MTAQLASICEELGVTMILSHVNRTPGTTKCSGTLQRIMSRRGEGHLILLLRTFMESENNRMALVEPILWGVSDVMMANPRWPDKGLAWLEAFDTIDLCDLWAKSKGAHGAPPERHGISAKLTEILQERFGEGQEGKLL